MSLNVLQLADALYALREGVAGLPLDGPVGWLLIVFFGVSFLATPWIMRWSSRQFKTGYEMLVHKAVGAGDAHVESGVVEVKGTATSLDETLSGKYTDGPAVAQKWHRKRVEEERDSDGNVSTSTRVVDRGSEAIPFLIEDETGTVAVDPSGASLSISQTHIHRSPTDIKHYEGRIEPGDAVYVYGQLIEADDPADAPGDTPTYIGDGGDVTEYVISDSGQLGTVFNYFLRGAMMMMVVGIGVLILAPLLFLFSLEEAFGIPTASWLFELL